MRNKRVSFRLTEEQLNMIDKNAEKSKLSRTAFILKACKGLPITVIEGGTEVAKELHKIGNNLNQITKMVNCGVVGVVDLSEVSDGVKRLWQSLNL